MNISFFDCFHAISPERSGFSKIATFFHALVALKLLVSLISRLVACSARIVVDRQTDGQTDTQNDYCNPRCACAPGINEYSKVPSHHLAMLYDEYTTLTVRYPVYTCLYCAHNDHVGYFLWHTVYSITRRDVH